MIIISKQHCADAGTLYAMVALLCHCVHHTVSIAHHNPRVTVPFATKMGHIRQIVVRLAKRAAIPCPRTSAQIQWQTVSVWHASCQKEAHKNFNCCLPFDTYCIYGTRQKKLDIPLC